MKEKYIETKIPIEGRMIITSVALSFKGEPAHRVNISLDDGTELRLWSDNDNRGAFIVFRLSEDGGGRTVWSSGLPSPYHKE
jgi:hypothetical protein